MFNETDILDSRETADDLGVEIGTIGWEDDPDPHFDINQESDDGVTLVKVQLFRGRVGGTTPKKGIAQGHKILARLSSQHGGLWSVPRKGRQCIVNFPGGFGLTPGAAVITAVAGAYVNDQFREDREIWDAGTDRDVLIKGRRVAIQDYEGNFLCVSPESGIQMVDKDGNGVHIKGGVVTLFASSGSPPDAKALIVLKDGRIDIIEKSSGGSFLSVGGGDISCQGSALKAAVGQALIGVGASPATAAVHAPGGAASIPSTSVFIGP